MTFKYFHSYKLHLRNNLIQSEKYLASFVTASSSIVVLSGVINFKYVSGWICNFKMLKPDWGHTMESYEAQERNLTMKMKYHKPQECFESSCKLWETNNCSFSKQDWNTH